MFAILRSCPGRPCDVRQLLFVERFRKSVQDGRPGSVMAGCECLPSPPGQGETEGEKKDDKPKPEGEKKDDKPKAEGKKKDDKPKAEGSKKWAASS